VGEGVGEEEGADRWTRLSAAQGKEAQQRLQPSWAGPGGRGKERARARAGGRENGSRPTGLLGPEGGKEGENEVFSFLFL
jgi:hypothetical protein